MTSHSQDLFDHFVSTLNFNLDPFQRESLEGIMAGDSLLVAAPTGSGKTLVAEFAVYLALANQQKLFYTAPMKALSNQKFSEFQQRFGEENVGLLTGDTNVNSQAPIIVMTTEVLRNMIYADSELLDGLAWVVMDEVHYLADRFRGAVWEEVIIHLNRNVRLISLSATVSNVGEFADWLESLRGKTRVVYSGHRPIPLHQHVLYRGELHNLFAQSHRSNTVSTSARVNPELTRLTKGQTAGTRYRGRRGYGAPSARQRLRRSKVINLLENENLLPAIFFVFSRAGCDDAVDQVLADGVNLLSQDERRQVVSLVKENTASLPREDLQALGYWRWLDGLKHGVASHHAGMLPIFKETVEQLFEKKLVKVVFATETLALGVNMPARTVVLEKLDKFNGESRVQITSGEYTQLTGRAGRRGIDVEGHSVIVWNEMVSAEELAALASRQSYPLISSFKPGYNMAVNLIDQFGMLRTRQVLESSFAQFQADRQVVHLAQKVRDQEASLHGFEKSVSCDLGDFHEYSGYRSELSELEKSKTMGFSKRRLVERQERISDLRALLRSHPCHHCPDREKHARWAERYWQLKRKTEKIRRQINNRTGQVVRTFDRVNRVLSQLDYLRADSEKELVTTPDSELLKQIYSERDLLVSEAVRQRIWVGLGAADLAAMISTIVYEPRFDRDYVEPKVPKGHFEAAFVHTKRLWDEINQIEIAEGLPGSEEPVADFALPLYRWATGASLDRVLDSGGMAAGDFVRWCKQVADLLDQLENAGIPELSRVAGKAKDLVMRGIVAYSSLS